MNEFSKINTLIYLFFTKDRYNNKRFNDIIDNAKYAEYTMISKGTEKYCIIKMYVKYRTNGYFKAVYHFKEHYERKYYERKN